MKAEKSCQTCLNRCMDMDLAPFFVAVNQPWGRVLWRGRPEECGPEFKLWKKDTCGERAERTP